MYRLKSIKIYFFSILKIFFLSLKNYYFKTSYYNKKLINFIPDRIFYYPSAHLSSSLTNISKDFYKINNATPELLWKTNIEDKRQFENLHSFLWLSKLDRKNNKIITKDIIKSWLNNFFNFNPKTWDMEITARRFIAWTSNTDITLENSNKNYQEKFFISLVKQSNFLLKNFKNLHYGPSKIICCAAIILSGLLFKQNEINYKIGIKELEKVTKNYFDQNGFPKSRNPEEVFISIKYLILIREWHK